MKIKDKTVITCIIAILVLIVVVGVLVITNKGKREEWVTLEENNNQVVDSSDYLSVISYLSLNSLPDNYYGYFYKNDRITVKNIDNKVKIYMAIRKVITDKKIDVSKSEMRINANDVEKALKLLFGSDVEYKHESLTGNSCSYTNFKYSKSDRVYIQKNDKCVEPRNGSIINEVIDVTSEKDKLIVN